MKNISGLEKYGIDINGVLDWLNGNGKITEIDGENYVEDEDYYGMLSDLSADDNSHIEKF